MYLWKYLQRVYHHGLPLDDQDRVFVQLDVLRLGKLLLEFLQDHLKIGLPRHLGAYLRSNPVVLHFLEIRHLHPHDLQGSIPEIVHVSLGCGGRVGGVPLSALLGSFLGVVLGGAESGPHLIDHRKSYPRIFAQWFGVVLHHAFETGGGFEGSFAVVLVLGIDELYDGALGLAEGLIVGVKLQHQLVDVT